MTPLKLLTCRFSVLATVGGILALSSLEAGPTFVPTNKDEFFAPYLKAFGDFTPGVSLDRALVQLGLPGTRHITVWYALPAGQVHTEISVEVNEKGWDRFKSFVHSAHGVGRVEINDLQPGTSYGITLNSESLGVHTLSARTPPEDDHPFSFVFGSCFAPYSYKEGKKDNDVTRIGRGEQASILNFRDRAQSETPPAFFLGLGDQVYVDPGAAEILVDRPSRGRLPRFTEASRERAPKIAYVYGSKSEKIRGSKEEVPAYLNTLYRLNLGLAPMDAAFRSMPSIMTWDDHDIRDGWGSQGDERDKEWRTYYQHARDAFVAFQAARNLDFEKVVNANGWFPKLPSTVITDNLDFGQQQQEEMHFKFHRGLATFFVADGRSAKVKGPMLKGTQFDEIKAWLSSEERADRPTVFVFSYPVPVLGNTGKAYLAGKKVPSSAKDDALDRIHRDDQKALLELFLRHFKDRPHHTLVILSGDVHYSSLQSLRLGSKDSRVFGYEIISSGMAQTSYNTRGGFWGTVSGSPRAHGCELAKGLWVQDHGMYSGPAFAELFIAPPISDQTAPRLGLEFYPAALDGVSYRLNTADVSSETALPIEAYPPNRPGRFGRTTWNDLPKFLKCRWLESGRATIYDGRTDNGQ